MFDFKMCKAGLGALATVAAMTLSQTGNAALTSYSQDFESCPGGEGFPPNCLATDGWLIFGNEYSVNPYTNPGSLPIGGYGPFPAADGAPGSIQAVVSGEGGLDQGDKQLDKFSDYNNGNQPSAWIEALTLQEQKFVEAGDLGSWTLSFDAKRGSGEFSIASDTTGNSSAYAFIKTIDGTSFFQKGFVSIDMTNAGIVDQWGTYSIELLIDSSLIGDILQFGFSATASNYSPSGIFYDNVSFAPTAIPVPAAVWLFGSGLIGLVGVARRRKG
jgi:hypothetical protein